MEESRLPTDRRRPVARLLEHAYAALRILMLYGLVGGGKILATLVSGGKIVEFRNRRRTYVMPGGRSTHYHLLESVGKLRLLAEYVQPDDQVIVDVGAHAGLFSAFALERAPSARAILVEPETAMRPLIERNLADFTWRLVSAAVTDGHGEATFYRAERSQESSLVRSAISGQSEPVQVQTVTLDEVCDDLDHVDVLKVDVQGAERMVLAGGPRTLSKVRTLLIEVALTDSGPHLLLQQLVDEFGPWRVVNFVRGGGDLAFVRGGERHRRAV